MDNKDLRITLDRPPRNMMDLVTARVAARGDEDSQVRAVLITGSGSAFGPGGDVKEAPPPGKTCPRYSRI
jgi:enoyl-CoA hydratase/carnithine racemase